MQGFELPTFLTYVIIYPDIKFLLRFFHNLVLHITFVTVELSVINCRSKENCS